MLTKSKTTIIRTGPRERIWSAGEGERLMEQRNPNNPVLISAKLEAKRDYSGAIAAIEHAIQKSPDPELSSLNSYLSDLLRRKRIYETE
jgi:hypothetical protein